jgi:hypothetical protein
MRVSSRVTGLLSGVALLAGLIIATPEAAQANVIPPDGWVELVLPLERVGRSYDLCLDVPDGDNRQGVRLQAFHCHGYDSHGNPQRWVFVDISDGSYEIENVGNHLCVTLLPLRDSNHLGIIAQQSCGDYAGQSWTIDPDPDDPTVEFHLRYGNECLAYLSEHEPVIWEECNWNYPNQVWALG